MKMGEYLEKLGGGGGQPPPCHPPSDAPGRPCNYLPIELETERSRFTVTGSSLGLPCFPENDR